MLLYSVNIDILVRYRYFESYRIVRSIST